MKNRLKDLYITEQSSLEDKTKWFLSYKAPEFTGAETMEIDEDLAKEILKIQNYDPKTQKTQTTV